MKKVNSLKIITLLLMIMLIICVSSNVFADDTQQIQTISSNSSGNSSIGTISSNSSGNGSIGTINTNSNSNSNSNDSSNTNINGNSNSNGSTNLSTNLPTTNTTKDSSTNQDLPSAGINSNSVIAFLTIATIISAIYTYKKIKEYNI